MPASSKNQPMSFLVLMDENYETVWRSMVWEHQIGKLAMFELQME